MPIQNIKNVDRIMEQTASQIRRRELVEDFGYNIVGGMPGDVLNPVDNSYMIRDALYMWQKNPLANSMIETFLDYVLGSGITYKAEDPRVQEVLDKFWFDHDNDWENKQVDRFRDLSLFGELILQATVGQHSGAVKINSIYPEHLKSQKRDSRYHERLEQITISGVGQDDEDLELDIVKYDTLNKKYVGNAFYFAINKSTFQSRGLSDLFVNRDWLRLHDKSLYANIERAGLLLSFVWDVTIKDASQEQLRAKLNQIVKNPPRPGGVRVHGDDEVWNEKTPNLGGRDFADIYKLLKGQISGGARQPTYMFGSEGEINRATAKEMGKPWLKKVNRRQRFVEYIIRSQFDFAIAKAIEHKMLGDDGDMINTNYTVTLPNPNEDVANDMADALFKFSNAIVLLQTNGIIDKKTSKSVVDMLISQMGVGEADDIEDVDEQEENVLEAKSKHLKKYRELVEKTK